MDIAKPKLTSQELIDKMKSKGIEFNIVDEGNAKVFLSNHNNYFRVSSYRKNYDKYQKGTNKGKYINLEFAYLVELSTIDMHLRFHIIKMCLDIEHFYKIQVLKDIENNSKEDGYSIVIEFLKREEWILDNIERKKTPYTCDLITKHFDFSKEIIEDKVKCPVWAFLEIVTFGEFLKFYDFYSSIYPTSYASLPTLNSIKSLRNACAHNNCVLHNIRRGYTWPNRIISTFVSQIKTIGKEERKNKLSSQPLYEFTCLLYIYNYIVPESIKDRRLLELKSLVNDRMLKHKEYFESQLLIKSSFNYLKKLVDFLV